MRPKKEINIRVGKNIQVVREAACYTQEQLSELLDMTPNHLSAIERGVSGATLETLEKICTMFNVSADTLLFGEQGRNNFEEDMAARLGRIKPEYRLQTKKILSALLEIIAAHETNKMNEDCQ